MKAAAMKPFWANRMKDGCVRLFCVAALCICVGISGCSRHEETFPARQTGANQKAVDSSPKISAHEKTTGPSIDSHFSKAQKAEYQSVSKAEPRIRVSIEPEQPVTGDGLSAKVAGAAAFGDEHALTYSWIVNGEKVEESLSPSLSKPVKCGDFVELRVGSSDPAQDVDSACSVFVGNAAPSIELVDQELNENGSYRAQFELSDPEQDSIVFSLLRAPAGMSVDADTRTLQWTLGSEQVGAFDVVVSAKDAAGAETLLTYQIKVAKQP